MERAAGAAPSAVQASGELVIRALQTFTGPSRWAPAPSIHALIGADGLDLQDQDLADQAWVASLDLLERCSAASPLASPSPEDRGAPPASLDAVSADLTRRALQLSGWNTRRVVATREGSQFHLVCDYENPEMATRAMAFALQIVNQVIAGDVQEAAMTEIFRSLCLDRGELGSIDRYVYQARERGIPVRRFGREENAIELGTGKYIRRTQGQMTAMCTVTGIQSAGDKSLTNKLLFDRGLPVPRSLEARNARQAVAAATKIGFPVVLKPLSGNHGRGVCINLRTPEEIQEFFPIASEVARSGSVVVETYLEGRDYRILVIDDKIAGVTERVPASVTGDGVHDIRDLIDAANAEPNRGKPFENILNYISIDEMVIDTLRRQDLTLADIPEAGQIVYVRQTANISSGGTSIDRTDEIHPDNAMVARMAAATMGLRMAGVDIIMPDIGKSVWETGGGIAEVNSGPGFRLHNRPFAGQPRDVVGAVLDMYYPEGTPCRVPVVAVVASDGELATLIADILTAGGRQVGLALPGKAVINGVAFDPTAADDASGSLVLRNAATEVAVIQVSDADLEFPGLPFEQVDVIVLGEQIDGEQAILDVLLSVFDPDGRVVTGAGDARASVLVEEHGPRTVLAGSDEPLIARHVDAGGAAFVAKTKGTGVELFVLSGETTTSIGDAPAVALLPLAIAAASSVQIPDDIRPAGASHT